MRYGQVIYHYEDENANDYGDDLEVVVRELASWEEEDEEIPTGSLVLDIMENGFCMYNLYLEADAVRVFKVQRNRGEY